MAPRIDSRRVPSLLTLDVTRTLGEALVPRVSEIVNHVRELALEPSAHPDDREHVGIYESQFRTASEAQDFFDWKIVEDFQQVVHDEFIDTTWPACPLHHRHPLTFDLNHTAWRCPADGEFVAALGNLGA